MYYMKGQNRFKKTPLDIGLRGFLCICNRHERECYREAMDLLTEYADRIYGPEVVTAEKTGEEADAKTDVQHDDEIEFELAKEISDMKQLQTKSKPRFMKMDTGVSDLVFIKTRLQDPNLIATTIFEEVISKGKQISMRLLRLIPIEATCKATKEDISKAAAEIVLPKHFGNSSKTYCVEFKSRYNNSITRHEVHSWLAQVFHEKFPNCHVEFKNPDVYIVVEVMQKICCLTALPHYKRFRKYNLIEVGQRGPTPVVVEKKEIDVDAQSAVVNETVGGDVDLGKVKAEIVEEVTSGGVDSVVSDKMDVHMELVVPKTETEVVVSEAKDEKVGIMDVEVQKDKSVVVSDLHRVKEEVDIVENQVMVKKEIDNEVDSGLTKKEVDQNV